MIDLVTLALQAVSYLAFLLFVALVIGAAIAAEIEFIEVVRLAIEAPEPGAKAPPAPEKSWTSRLRSR